MKRGPYRTATASFLLAFLGTAAHGGNLDLTIEPAEQVKSVGIVRRFNDDASLARAVDPKAKFSAPYRDNHGEGNRLRVTNLTPGTYDAIVFLKDGTRLEGFHWPRFHEFDEPPAGDPPPDEVDTEIRRQIKLARIYENKPSVLALVGNEERVLVFMQLLRDESSTFDGEYGQPVATLRYEFWQFTNKGGGWAREKNTKLLHRILDGRSFVLKQRWLWDGKLGGMVVSSGTETVQHTYTLPADLGQLPGLKP